MSAVLHHRLHHFLNEVYLCTNFHRTQGLLHKASSSVVIFVLFLLVGIVVYFTLTLVKRHFTSIANIIVIVVGCHCERVAGKQ